MNWKSEAIGKLKGYRQHKAAIDNLQIEISRLKSEAESIRSANKTSTPVQGGGPSREDMLLSNIVLREELRRQLRSARLWVTMVDNALESLDAEERALLEDIYFAEDRTPLIVICESWHMERSTFYRRRDDALRHFVAALYGIDA